jgi:hypothetical protein
VRGNGCARIPHGGAINGSADGKEKEREDGRDQVLAAAKQR